MKNLIKSLAKLAGLLAGVALVGAPVAAFAGLPLATAPIIGGLLVAVVTG